MCCRGHVLPADRLIEASPENRLAAMKWVQADLTARGTTDINAPLQRALKLLDGARGLPFVFLLTDGRCS
jgi:Mg-chelatase subunit ChlD